MHCLSTRASSAQDNLKSSDRFRFRSGRSELEDEENRSSGWDAVEQIRVTSDFIHFSDETTRVMRFGE